MRFSKPVVSCSRGKAMRGVLTFGILSVTGNPVDDKWHLVAKSTRKTPHRPLSVRRSISLVDQTDRVNTWQRHADMDTSAINAHLYELMCIINVPSSAATLIRGMTCITKHFSERPSCHAMNIPIHEKCEN